MNKKELILKLHEVNAIKFDEFKLVTGILSPIYFDLKVTVSYPELLTQMARAMEEKVKELEYDLICGVPYMALPIATLLSVWLNKPMIMRRKEVKTYGTKRTIEGVYQPGQSALIIEDVVTGGTSVFETIEPLERENLKVRDVVVLIDREQGGKKNLSEKGYTLHAVMSISEILTTLEEAGKLSRDTVESVNRFIRNNQVLPIRKT